jgi:hypothetical protein
VLKSTASSNAGLFYGDGDEFEALSRLIGDAGAPRAGEAGRRYSKQTTAGKSCSTATARHRAAARAIDSTEIQRPDHSHRHVRSSFDTSSVPSRSVARSTEGGTPGRAEMTSRP